MLPSFVEYYQFFKVIRLENVFANYYNIIKKKMKVGK